MEAAPGLGTELTFARELPLTRTAIVFASEHHGGQVREADRAPFLMHTLEVVSLRMLVAAGMPPERFEVRRRRYRKSLGMLEEAIPDQRVVELLRFELEALETIPPRPAHAGGSRGPER